MAKDLAVVLNNGSINSAVVTALAAQKYRLVMIHAEIAPQPGSRPRAAYDLQVQHFKPYREHSLAMPFLGPVQPEGLESALAGDPRIPQAIVPKLLHLLPLLATASRYAVHYQACAIYTGLRVGSHGDELAQATEFIQIWREMLQLPCQQPDMEVETPLLELEPWQVVDVGFQVAAPFERTWSCAEQAGDPCWACRGCRAREAAFQQSGKPDPMRIVRKV